MKATELRIGNFVLLDNPMHRPRESGEIHKVVGISEKSAHIMRINDNLMEDYYGQFYKFIKPIPLTEEWLLNFGFEKKSGSEFKNDRFIYRFKQRDLIIEGFEYDYNGILCYPEYVHQLQNLYFALTGEELTQVSEGKNKNFV